MTSTNTKPNILLLEKISSDLSTIRNDIFMIKNEIKIIKDVIIQEKREKDTADNEWIKEEETIGWRLW
jgi:hypothetical protein